MKPRADGAVTHGQLKTAERRKSKNTITVVEVSSFRDTVVRLSVSYNMDA